MTVYNTTLLTNIAIVQKAKQWFARNLITTDQMATILNRYPDTYYKPNVFIKIGLFLFTWFLVGAAFGIYSLITFMIFAQLESFIAYGIITSLLFAGLSIFALEKLIKWRNWYSNGIDDALTYIAVIAIGSFLGFCTSEIYNESDAFLVFCFLFFPVLVFAMRRYLDRILAIAAVICFYCISFLLIMKIGSIAKLIMPFAFMAISLSLYFFIKKQIPKEKYFHLINCFKVIKVISLVVFYLSGNYYVIRESSIEFFGMVLLPGMDVPMAFVFYAFTALVPLIYLYFALKNKDKLLLLVSLLLIAAAALTFKYYFSLGHPEITLTLAGLVMILVAYASIRYLKEDKKGITFKDDSDEDNFIKSHAESLIIAQSFGAKSADPNMDMGGGTFGGGGSGNKF